MGCEGAAKFSWVQERASLPIRHLGSGLHHVSGPGSPEPGEGGGAAQLETGVGKWGLAEYRRGTDGLRCS